MSEEHLVWCDGQVARTRCVRLLTGPDTWDPELVMGVNCAVWDCSGHLEQEEPEQQQVGVEVDHEGGVEGVQPERAVPPPDPVPRSLQIQAKHLQRFGFTPGCPKCQRTIAGDYSNARIAHSTECRARVYAAMRSSPSLLAPKASCSTRAKEEIL